MARMKGICFPSNLATGEWIDWTEIISVKLKRLSGSVVLTHRPMTNDSGRCTKLFDAPQCLAASHWCVDSLRVLVINGTHEKKGSCWQDFFPDPVPKNIIPLGNLFSPNFGIFKVWGGRPMEKYSATLGLQPKKSVEFLGTEFVGDLQRDKQGLGHWNFIQRCLPPWSQNWFWIFFVYHVRLGVVPFFGNGHLFRKKLGPKKFIRDKFGYKPL